MRTPIKKNHFSTQNGWSPSKVFQLGDSKENLGAMSAVDAVCGNFDTPFYILILGICFSFFIKMVIIYEYYVPVVSPLKRCFYCVCCWCCKKKGKSVRTQLPQEIQVSFEGRKDIIRLAIAGRYRLVRADHFEFECMDSLNQLDERVPRQGHIRRPFRRYPNQPVVPVQVEGGSRRVDSCRR